MLDQISSSAVLWTGGAAATALALHVYLTYSRNSQAVNHNPGFRTIVSILRPTMRILPSGKIPYTNWYFSIGPVLLASKGHEVFRHYGQDIITGLSIDLYPPNILVADAEAAQEVLVNRGSFRKPIEIYGVVNLYGRNILATEYDEWKTHRKIASPSFSENNNRLVREETIVIIEGLFETWKETPVIQFEASDVMAALTLMVICSAGFGKRVSWEDTAPPPGHQLTFKDAVGIVTRDMFIKVAVPDFAMNLTERTARVQLGFTELKNYIHEIIQERSNNRQVHSDLLSNLIAANESNDEGRQLTRDEVAGDIFVFLFAGHETTAHTLGFAFGLLALYPEVQEKLYQHIVEQVEDPSGAPTYSELASLTYVTAVFNETLRLYSPLTVIPKWSTKDSILRTENSKGEPVAVPVPKDSFINVVIPALHRNPKYWKDPEEFMPERFLGDWPKHAFVPFSLGGRSCIGKRFAEVEMIVALSMFIRNYRVEVQPGQLVAGETLQERRARILAAFDVVTLTPKRIALTLTRR